MISSNFTVPLYNETCYSRENYLHEDCLRSYVDLRRLKYPNLWKIHFMISRIFSEGESVHKNGQGSSQSNVNSTRKSNGAIIANIILWFWQTLFYNCICAMIISLYSAIFHKRARPAIESQFNFDCKYEIDWNKRTLSIMRPLLSHMPNYRSVDPTVGQQSDVQSLEDNTCYYVYIST